MKPEGGPLTDAISNGLGPPPLDPPAPRAEGGLDRRHQLRRRPGDERGEGREPLVEGEDLEQHVQVRHVGERRQRGRIGVGRGTERLPDAPGAAATEHNAGDDLPPRCPGLDVAQLGVVLHRPPSTVAATDRRHAHVVHREAVTGGRLQGALQQPPDRLRVVGRPQLTRLILARFWQLASSAPHRSP